MPSPSSMPSSVWPSSLALNPRRREWGSSASIWAPQNSTSFDPFASDLAWDTSRPLFNPPKNEAVKSPNPESPEHISMMLRDLGITPSPRPTSDTPRELASPSTPPMLSPTTQILSLGSNSTIHTPTPTRVMEPSLFTPKLSDNPSQLLFSSVNDTPTARRVSMSSASDEVLIPPPHSRRNTATNIPPRLASIGGPAPHSHERVMSWMQRQSMASAQSSPALGSFSQVPPKQDWLPISGPSQVPVPGTNLAALPGWNPPRGVRVNMWNPQAQPLRPTGGFVGRDDRKVPEAGLHEPVNFLHLLQPSSQPPYSLFVTRIVKNSDQQASIFLQQKLKAATSEETRKPIMNRFGNWAVQRCLEAPCTPRERKRMAEVMQGRVIELATNCYGTHVVQKALDCTEPIQMMVVSEMLQGDLATTLMNKHASHVWTKIMELSWSDPAPPIFDYVNKAMKGRWADLARHETGSLIVQHAFENLDESDKSDCVREVLDGIDTLATDQWGSWVVQHLLENGTENDRTQAVGALVQHIATLAVDPQGIKVIEKAIKSGGPSAVESVARRLSQPAKSGRRPMIVDLALGAMGSQLISMLLPMLNKTLWSVLHDSVKGHIVTLKGSKSGSRIVWLFERTKAQHNTN